jgi:hypothetical protein
MMAVRLRLLSRSDLMSNVRLAYAMLREGKRMGMASWTAIVVLLALLGLTVAGAYYAWTLNSDIPVPESGYLAMTFGVIITLVVGVGLMALIFYSSRTGYDAAPKVQQEEEDHTP